MAQERKPLLTELQEKAQSLAAVAKQQGGEQEEFQTALNHFLQVIQARRSGGLTPDEEKELRKNIFNNIPDKFYSAPITSEMRVGSRFTSQSGFVFDQAITGMNRYLKNEYGQAEEKASTLA